MVDDPHVIPCASPLDAEPADGSYFVAAYPPFPFWNESLVRYANDVLATPPVAPPEAPLGIYVHVPFCAKRCDYCYFRSFAGGTNGEKDDYVDAVIEEAKNYRRSPALSDRALSFIYFGGGTPSLLSDRQIRTLLTGLQDAFPWDDVEEVTFECAPKTVTLAKLHTLRQLGVTRLSMGVQHWDDQVLQRSGRIHLVQDAERAYAWIQEVGFDVVNLDLIVGLGGETDASFLGGVERCIELGPACVTIYQLEVPHNTPLYRTLYDAESPAPLPSWALKRRRLASGFELLERAGYTVRSAYAAVRDPAVHRFVYQDAQYHGADLIGLGLASFSYVGGVHFQNISRMEPYLECVSRQEFPIGRAYLLSREEQMVREIVLQLKLGGVSRDYFRRKYDVDVVARFAPQWNAFAARGWLRVGPQGVRLTREGLLRADRLVLAFYRPSHVTE